MKILHIFWVDELNFSSRTIDIFGRDARNEHFYLCLYDDVYEKNANNKNCICYQNYDNKQAAKIVNTMSQQYDFLIFHGSCGPLQFLMIKKEIIKKIVWRTWGGDVGYEIKQVSVKTVIKSVVNKLFFKKVSHLCLVGYANDVDLVNLREKLPNVKKMRFPYHSRTSYSVLVNELATQIDKKEKTVLLGHSGFLEDNHIAVLDSLKSFKNENLHIFIPLSYGDPDYINSVEKYISEECKDQRITIIRDYMSYKDFIHFLNMMDVGIFDGTISYALGNISPLLFLQKKLFLNRDGMIAKTLKEKRIPYGTTDNISNMSFKEFIHPFDYSNSDMKNFCASPFEVNEGRIKEIIDYLYEYKQSK